LAQTGRFDDATHVYEQALGIYRETGDRHSEAYALTNVGLAMRDAGREEAGRRYFESALVLFDSMGAPEVTQLHDLLDEAHSGE
jgi:tetratricopeptide (TPR) repeat protein